MPVNGWEPAVTNMVLTLTNCWFPCLADLLDMGWHGAHTIQMLKSKLSGQKKLRIWIIVLYFPPHPHSICRKDRLAQLRAVPTKNAFWIAAWAAAKVYQLIPTMLASVSFRMMASLSQAALQPTTPVTQRITRIASESIKSNIVHREPII